MSPVKKNDNNQIGKREQDASIAEKVKKFLKNHYLIDIAAIVVTLLFIAAGVLVSVHRFWQYEVFYYNFGVFDQAIWHVSRFQPPIIEHLIVGGKLSLADHFDLSILLLAPLFWITKQSEILLIVQALFAGLAGLVIYKIGLEILKDKFVALCISTCYFLFVGIQNAVITDFQELTIMTLPITLTFLAIIKKRVKLFWLLFLLTLGFKEVTFLLGIGIAVFIFFYRPEWRRIAYLASVVSILWGYLTINYLIPYFSDGIYVHRPDLPDGISGKIFAMFDDPLKRKTVYFSLLNFGFLPLFTPSMWFVILQDYALRFLPKYVYTRWSLGLHYNAQVATLLAISSVFGFYYLQKFKIFLKLKYLLALLLIINSFIQFRFIHHGPFLMSLNPVFYKHTDDFKFLDELIKRIPLSASIMTQNNLGVRFTHQKFIYLRLNYENYKPDYVLIDNREGQNPNNYLLGPSLDELIVKLKRDKNYKLDYHTGEQYIFKRR